MMDMGVACPSAQGQADDEHGQPHSRRHRRRGSGPTRAQIKKGDDGTAMTAGTKTADTRSTSLCTGRESAALPLHLHDPRGIVSAYARAHYEPAVASACRDRLSPGRLVTASILP